MTNQDAATSIYNIIQMMLTIGLPLCMVAGWRDAGAGAKQKTNMTTRRAKRKRRHAVKKNEVIEAPRKAKAAARPLSEFEDRILADYFVKRNFTSLAV